MPRVFPGAPVLRASNTGSIPRRLKYPRSNGPGFSLRNSEQGLTYYYTPPGPDLNDIFKHRGNTCAHYARRLNATEDELLEVDALVARVERDEQLRADAMDPDAVRVNTTPQARFEAFERAEARRNKTRNELREARQDIVDDRSIFRDRLRDCYRIGWNRIHKNQNWRSSDTNLRYPAYAKKRDNSNRRIYY